MGQKFVEKKHSRPPKTSNPGFEVPENHFKILFSGLTTGNDMTGE